MRPVYATDPSEEDTVEEAEEEKRKKKGLVLAGHDSIKEAFGKEKVGA